MSESSEFKPEGYKEIPEADRKKAQSFFGHARNAVANGNYDYAIEMYLQGLGIDPDSVEAHAALRDVGLRRKATGGKGGGMFGGLTGKFKRASKDPKLDMLAAEKLMANDPGNTNHMGDMIKSALKGGFFDTVLWLGPILQKANNDSGKGEDFGKYILLKDVYHEMAMSEDTPLALKAMLMKRAVEAIELAVGMKPDDMDLITERKNLSARHTMFEGNYGTGGSFRDSVRDKDKQEELMRGDSDIRTVDQMSRIIAVAQREYDAQPNEAGKLMKLVEALAKTEDSEFENKAIELLQQWYDRTKQFRFRLNIGKIRMAQMNRMARTLKADRDANPNDAMAKQTFEEFEKERLTEELSEFQLWAENYPTESTYRYHAATRMYQLGRYDEAIPLLQEVRMDPKYKFEASIALGRAFFEAGYVDEAADTLHAIIEQYQARGDSKSKEMNYWYARSLESKGDVPAALKAYSTVAQMDFTYRDVQTRIKSLKAPK